MRWWCSGERESRLYVASLDPPSWVSVPVSDWLLAFSSTSAQQRHWSDWRPEPAVQGPIGHARRKLQVTGSASCSRLRVEEASGGKGKAIDSSSVDGTAAAARHGKATRGFGTRSGWDGGGREVRMNQRDPEGRAQQRERARGVVYRACCAPFCYIRP